MNPDLFSVRTLKNLLRKHNFQPSKRLGQNFLINRQALKKIIEAAELQPTDTVLEVGPGPGILTLELAKRIRLVIAVEKDVKMVEILKETTKEFKNVKIIQGDILKFKIENLKLKTYKVVANLPYYIVSPVIRKFLEAKNPPKQMVLMIQKEVAQRICAQPPKMNLLAASVRFYAKPEIQGYVKKQSFWPRPKVDAAILRIAPLINTAQKPVNADLFFKIVKAGFSQPRKQLVNNLSKSLKLNKEKIRSWLLKNNIRPEQRAETLTNKDWKNLTNNFPFL